MLVVLHLLESWIRQMAKDGDPGVRADVASWVTGLSLVAMLADEDTHVRLAAVERIEEPVHAPFLDDPESIICELAYSRLFASSKRQVSRLMNDSSLVTSRAPCGLKELTL